MGMALAQNMQMDLTMASDGLRSSMELEGMMGTKHKHYDAIVAWANGEEIQHELKGDWVDINEPDWYETVNYRIKPKRVKKEGWVNVYSDKYEDYEVRYHRTQYAADRHATPGRITCIRIEWEEEA